MPESSKSDVDRLGSILRAGNYSSGDLIRLDLYRRSFGDDYKYVVDVVQNQLHLNVTGRPSKSTNSIVDKLNRESTRLSQMQDIAGCRVVVEDVVVQNRFVAAIEVYLDATIIDRRANPSHGYRAVHLICRRNGRPVEIQVRTVLQHMWAEISEKLSDTVDPGLKYGVGNEQTLGVLNKLSTAVLEFENEEIERAIALRKISEKTAVPKPIKKQLKELEKGFSRRRSTLLSLLENINKLATT